MREKCYKRGCGRKGRLMSFFGGSWGGKHMSKSEYACGLHRNAYHRKEARKTIASIKRAGKIMASWGKP